MTDHEWTTLTLPEVTYYARGVPGFYRKLRLFAIACFRAIPAIDRDPRSDAAVAVAERYADGLAGPAELGAAERLAQSVVGESRVPAAPGALAAHVALEACAREDSNFDWRVRHAADDAADAVAWSPSGFSNPTALQRRDGVRQRQLDLFRDLVPNPSRPVSFDPAWLTADVVSLARGVYEDRAFDRLPILGDALMDAGCTDAEVLGHCRHAGPHARGCWLIDVLLGRG